MRLRLTVTCAGCPYGTFGAASRPRIQRSSAFLFYQSGLGYAAGAAASSSVKPRVLFGSTGMPGPIVVVNVTFFR
jgi:hypothetical protein